MSKFATIRAAWPVLKRALRSGQLFRPQCELVTPQSDIVARYDVEIPISGHHLLTANVFLSREQDRLKRPAPVVMCAHPYDNHLLPALKTTPFGGPPLQYRLLPQSGGRPSFSTLTSWESPDPNFWVPAGYTVVNLNLPGFANSGGPASVMTEHQGAAFRQAIAWVGAQDWCTGSVGLCGVSFLCISQYLAATCSDDSPLPDALKCIIPWEGLSDIYQDVACRGGIADRGFLNFWWHTEVKDNLNVSLAAFLAMEEATPPDILDLHPTYDAYWKAKVPKLENITVPMLQCGSFSDHELHTFGSFRAFEKAQSKHKWLYTHRGGKWTEFYRPECLALQRDFMDHFLKGQPTRFEDLPQARIEVRSDRDTVTEVRWEPQWPPVQTEYQKYFLRDGAALSRKPQPDLSETIYDGKSGQAQFDWTFGADTEVTGYIALKLWVEARDDGTSSDGPKDLSVCCFVDKLDRHGRSVRFYGTAGHDQDVVTRGYGRAARRALNQSASKPHHPVMLNTQDMWLTPGEIVPLEIAFCPSATQYYAGETLRLIVAAQDLVHGPIFAKDTSANWGRHVLHFGADFDSHLLLPVMSSPVG
ncbi:MAG: CocE/NonD family hydrolase [Pseudomonadota bacterium]